MEEGRKDDFYNRPQSVLDKQREKDLTILMGNCKAKIGGGNSGYEHVMGEQGLERMNENGELLADLCNNMVIGGSVFPHKDTHKAIWRSPDHVT